MAGTSSTSQHARVGLSRVPAALLGGAYGSEIWGGLVPCEMCWWQRYAHLAALAFAVAAVLVGRRGGMRGLVVLAALGVAVSGAIGAYHAGVEAGLFEGFTQCTSAGGASLSDLLAAPIVRCDQVQWRFLGVSMAGWNALISLGAAGVTLWLARGRRA